MAARYQEGMNYPQDMAAHWLPETASKVFTFTNLEAWGKDTASAPNTEATSVNWKEDIIVQKSYQD